MTLLLANSAHVKHACGLDPRERARGRNTDVVDAVWLSDLMADGLSRASFVPEPATQSMQALLRNHKQKVRGRRG